MARSLLDRGPLGRGARAAARGRARAGSGEVAARASWSRRSCALRRGEPGADALLAAGAREELAGVPEGARHAASFAPRSPRRRGCAATVARGLREQALAGRRGDACRLSSRARPESWRCGPRAAATRLAPPPRAPEPVLRELAGDWRGAIRRVARARRALRGRARSAARRRPRGARRGGGAPAARRERPPRAPSRGSVPRTGPRAARPAPLDARQRRRPHPARAGGARARRPRRDQRRDRAGAAPLRADGRAPRLGDPREARRRHAHGRRRRGPRRRGAARETSRSTPGAT